MPRARVLNPPALLPRCEASDALGTCRHREVPAGLVYGLPGVPGKGVRLLGRNEHHATWPVLGWGAAVQEGSRHPVIETRGGMSRTAARNASERIEMSGSRG